MNDQRRLFATCGMLLTAFLAFYSFPASVSAQAAPKYGLTYFDQGLLSGGKVVAPGVEVQNLEKHNYSHQFSISDSLGDSAAVEGKITDGKLYGHAKTVVGTSFEQNSYAGMDAYFFDTFYITGPAGQTGNFEIDMTFTGTVTTTCPPDSPAPDCLITAYANNFDVVENGIVVPGQEYEGIIATIGKTTETPNDQTASVTLSLGAGTSVVLGELLQIRNAVENQEKPGYLTFGSHDKDETAYITVTSLTPGFSFTTASGLKYTNEGGPSYF